MCYIPVRLPPRWDLGISTLRVTVKHDIVNHQDEISGARSCASINAIEAEIPGYAARSNGGTTREDFISAHIIYRVADICSQSLAQPPLEKKIAATVFGPRNLGAEFNRVIVPGVEEEHPDELSPAGAGCRAGVSVP